MKATFNFGKICMNYAGRKENLVTVDVELRKRGGEPVLAKDPDSGKYIPTGDTTPEYVEFSASANVWNRIQSDIIIGGQCLDEINKHRAQLSDLKTWDFIYRMWKKYHLNGMHAGTPEQEKAVADWEAAGNKYDYAAACEMLKEKGLYEVPFTGATIGKRYHGEMYKYGREWVIQDIPADDLLRIEHVISARNAQID